MAQAMTSSGMPAFTSHNFSRVPNVTKPRSSFDRSKPVKTTLTAGYWTPVFLDEILPGDTFDVSANIFARLLSPLSVPIMDNMYMDWIAIYCPNRLLWEHFVNQMGEQPNGPDDTIDYLTPQITVPDDGFVSGSLADYFGLPLGIGPGNTDNGLPGCNALPFRMYNLFMRQWVVPQNVVAGPDMAIDDGPDDYSIYNLWNRAKRPDYFVSSQPATQKGSPVELPLGGDAAVHFPSGIQDLYTDGSFYQHTGNAFISNSQITSTTAFATLGGITGTLPIDNPALKSSWDNPTDAYADMATATGPTINDIRLLVTTQQFLELDEKGGTRYPEFVHNHFGVQSSDARLQRVEYIGAGTIPIMTHVVPQTSPVISGSTPQANLAGFTSASGRVEFSHSFEEHGFLMVLVEIRADVTYQQNLHKMWTRSTRYDYYDPLFANIGEQPVMNYELYTDGENDDETVFGYQEYAAEYRFGFAQITGLMRAGVTDSVSIYNLALDFGSRPTLSASFLNDDPPISRICAVEAEPVFIFDSFWKIKSTRVMPTFSIPGLTRI